MHCDFAIVFICAGGYEYFKKILEQNIESLCSNTIENYELILFLDGIENYDVTPYLKLAEKLGVDEIRLRSRNNNCATGDCSNNSHINVFSDKTKYLITIESDVVIFKIDDKFDVLHEIRCQFEKNTNLAIATKIDDYDCWQEKMVFLEDTFGGGVMNVNRVSSHFLIYNTLRCREIFNKQNCFDGDSFYSTDTTWYNYEDMITRNFKTPNGPGIGFFSSFPIKVYHCDEKVKEGSAFYKKDLDTRIKVLRKREAEILHLKGNKYE